ncbi:MAG: hypothetical protein FWC22_05980 [Treponema sp.]|nr:hypothetical protein [Treponema sp.]
MNSILKVLGFFIPVFLLISPLSAQTIFDEETTAIEESIETEAPSAIEELTAAEEFFPDEELLLSEEDVSAEKSLVHEGSSEHFIFEAPDLIIEVPPFETRSFSELFPRINTRMAILSSHGFRYAFEKDGSPSIIPSIGSGIDLLSSVMEKEPSHIIEALVLLPYKERELDILDIYNTLGRIENIKDQTLQSSSGEPVYIFKETTRLVSAQRRRAIPDPEPADTLPFSETLYLRFTDAYIGSLFLRGDMSLSLYGITYTLTNFRDVNFSIFSIMKAERLSINIYIEPIKEGILIYSVSGIYLPGFIIKRVNLTPNMNARISVLIEWIAEGLRKQDSITVDKEREEYIRSILQKNRIYRMLMENTN